jgi:hypothetical protein
MPGLHAELLCRHALWSQCTTHTHMHDARAPANGFGAALNAATQDMPVMPAMGE